MATIRRLPSGKWQAGVMHPSGKRVYKTDPLKKVVQDWAGDLEQQIRRGTFVDPNAGKMRLEEWWALWSAARTVEPATASKAETHWRLYVAPAFGSWPLVTIQQFDVQQWIAKLVKDNPKTAEANATAVRLLVQVLEAAVVAKKIPINPAAGMKAPTPPKHVDRFLDTDESGRLLESVTMPVPTREGMERNKPRPRIPDPTNRLFVKLMLDAGLRWQEAAGQHRFRVDLKRRRLRVQEVIEKGTGRIKPKPKSEAGARWVPLTDELVEDLEAYLEEHPGDGLLFTDADGGVLNYDNWLKRVWNPAIAAAGLDDPQPTPHDCRHSYGSWLADQGMNAHDIAKLMGHGSLRAVERYIHASEARMQRARDALSARGAHGGESQKQKTPSPKLGNGA